MFESVKHDLQSPGYSGRPRQIPSSRSRSGLTCRTKNSAGCRKNVLGIAIYNGPLRTGANRVEGILGRDSKRSWAELQGTYPHTLDMYDAGNNFRLGSLERGL